MERGQETGAGEAGVLAGCAWWEEAGESVVGRNRGSLSRAGWQGATASEAGASGEEGSAGRGAAWALGSEGPCC